MLDGLQRAKLLARMKIQLRGVQEEEEFGKFALTNQIQRMSGKGKGRRFV
jgi:hypothetical protein